MRRTFRRPLSGRGFLATRKEICYNCLSDRQRLLESAVKQYNSTRENVMPRPPKPKIWKPGILKSLLQRDVVDMLILTLLCRRAMYGYEMRQQLADMTEQVLLYDKLSSALNRLQRQAFICKIDTPPDGDDARVYFTITEEGRLHLREMVADYHAFTAAADSVIGGANP